MKKRLIIFAIALFAIILIIIPLTSNDDYKELNNTTKNISAINISKTKSEKLKEGFKYSENDTSHKIYYYGIDKVEFIINNNEFNMQNLFKENILNREILQEYLDKEYDSGNSNREIINNEANIYRNDNYSVIVCNTKDGNKDIYFGIKEMKKLDEYCK